MDGSAFHLYAGKIDALSAVHDAHPDKHLYFTEQWIAAPGNLRGDLTWHTRLLNNSKTKLTFSVRYHGKAATSSLNSGAVGTYVW